MVTRRTTIAAMGGTFLLIQVCSFIAYARNSGGNAEEVIQFDVNPCRPISFNGLMIPSVPEYMPSLLGLINGIARHFVCRPASSTGNETETTTISTMESTTVYKTTTGIPPFDGESSTFSSTESTNLAYTTTTMTTEPNVKIFLTDKMGNEIFVSDLKDPLNFTSIPSTEQPRFITYDSVDKRIYWTDRGGDKLVYRAHIDGENREKITRKAQGELRGLSIAETSRTIYIGHSNPTRITSMSIREGSMIPGDEKDFETLNDEPISLEVDEEQGYLYWTETVGRIRRKPLDGNGQPQDLFTNSNLSHLYGLTIGFSSGGSRHIFFCDFNQQKTFYGGIDVADGSLSTTELTNHLQASGYDKADQRLRDITYFNGVLYWAKQDLPPSIAVMNFSSRSYEIKETSGVGKPYQLVIATA